MANKKKIISTAILGLFLTVGGLLVIGHTSSPTPPNYPCTQGCTPGFWKNHVELWAGFVPTDKLNVVFNFVWAHPGIQYLGEMTLLDALQFGGGDGVDGAAKIYFRQMVSALLNITHAGVNYPLEPITVDMDGDGTPETLLNQLESFRWIVRGDLGAWSAGDQYYREYLLTKASYFLAWNELYCPIDARGRIK